MRAIISVLALVLCLGVTTNGFAADSYLCVADKATGFRYYKETKKWGQANFNVETQKYVFSKSESSFSKPDKPVFKWELTEMGQDTPWITIYNEDFSQDGTIKGEGHNFRFIMNKKSLRYLKSHSNGYLDGIDSNDNTPYIEIGKCSQL